MFAKSSEARFCNIFKNFWNYTRSNQILYERKKTHSEKNILLRREFFVIIGLVWSIRCIESPPFPRPLPPLPRPAMMNGQPTITFSLYKGSACKIKGTNSTVSLSVAERSRARLSDITSEIAGSNSTRGELFQKIKSIFFYNWRQIL